MIWSQNEEAYLKENYQKTNVSYKIMEKKLKRTKRAICHKASRLNLKRGKAPINKSKTPRIEYDRTYFLKNKEIILNKRKKRAKDLKKYLVNKLGDKCSMCKKSFPCVAYDFHHKKNKKENMALLINNGYKKIALEEVKKCILFCANCHRIFHFE